MISKCIALIPCAGSGVRFGSDLPKQYNKIGDRTVLEYTLQAFIDSELIEQILVVANPTDRIIDKIIDKIANTKVIVAKIGGESRAETVLNGLNHLGVDKHDWILVHDAARCCITTELIGKQIKELNNDLVGGILAIPATDTIKYVNGNVIEKTLDRTKIFLAQTPQMFRYEILKTALNHANLELITDEAAAVENLNMEVKVVNGSINNIKITIKDDLEQAKLILLER
ncbi:MAG: 2-C-methyl-D-erythritol 4-phosphate cytidylyltransferase [Neisseriaceae bacterium]